MTKTAKNIYALFLAEVIQLNPNVVTFYEGTNDVEYAVRHYMRSNKGVFSRFVIKTGKYSIIVGFVNSIFDIGLKTVYSPAEVQKLSSRVSNNFSNNVSRIHQECKERDILFVLANQQKNSQTIDRKKMKGITYEEEVEEIRARLLQSKQMQVVRTQAPHACCSNEGSCDIGKVKTVALCGCDCQIESRSRCHGQLGSFEPQGKSYVSGSIC
jgi:hypothetical protein